MCRRHFIDVMNLEINSRSNLILNYCSWYHESLPTISCHPLTDSLKEDHEAISHSQSKTTFGCTGAQVYKPIPSLNSLHEQIVREWKMQNEYEPNQSVLFLKICKAIIDFTPSQVYLMENLKRHQFAPTNTREKMGPFEFSTLISICYLIYSCFRPFFIIKFFRARSHAQLGNSKYFWHDYE